MKLKKKEYFHYFIHSISLKLLSLILLTVVPIALLLIYNNNRSREILLEQIEDTHTNMLRSYVEQLDTQLNTALSYSLNLAINETDPQIIVLSEEEAPVQYAKLRVLNDMNENLLSNDFVNGYFLYAREKDGFVNFIHASNQQQNILWSEYLQPIVVSSMKDGSREVKWQFCTMDGKDYLLLTAQSDDAICAGAYVYISYLFTNFFPKNLSGSQLSLIPANELPEFSSQFSEDTQMVSCASGSADLILAETFSRSEILDSLPFMQKYTVMISAIVVILVVVLVLLVQKVVSVPILHLSAAMYRIQNGDLDYRITPVKASTEIEILNNSFNRMLDEIQGLKINVYEEKLNAQKSQLRNLQLQIKPHFLINSLNMIYNLIETDQLPLARRLIQYSIEYFRYMVKVDEDLVPLNEEIDHVRAYLEIQSIRYQNLFTYDIQVDPMVDDMLIPPVMIQNLVENSMKYALSLTDVLHITVRVVSFEEDYFPYGKITVSDTGQGFPAEQLESLNHGEKIIKKDGEHIGVRNTLQRLSLLFADKAAWKFYNDQGAVSEITLPATFAKTEEDDLE